MKKCYTAVTQKDVQCVIIFKEFNSNIYQILSFTPFVYFDVYIDFVSCLS